MNGKSPNVLKSYLCLLDGPMSILLHARKALGLCSDIYFFPLSQQDSSGADFASSLRKGWDNQRMAGHLIKDWPIRVKETQFGTLVLSTREEGFFPFLMCRKT